jgi:hypothetical protein
MVELDFDYADTKGSFVARGRPAADGSLTLEFVEWKQRPGDYAPITPEGTVDAASGEYVGTLKEQGCQDFKYVRRRPG